MTKTNVTTKCADCGTMIDDSANSSEQKVPCKVCGSLKRIYEVFIMETLTLRDGMGLKAKRPNQKKPYVEDISIPNRSHSRGKQVHLKRVIDRDNDKYYEKVTDYETGEIIHQCEEPLSMHSGHGNAKKKK